VSGAAPGVFTAAEARMFPEFRSHGPLHFLVPSTIGYLRQNRSGFDLRTSGSILALAALALLLVRRSNFRLLRTEVLALPVVSLAAYALAQAVLFKLYLPHRYTYPLVAFFAIAVGVTIRPTWAALWKRPRPRLRAFALLAAPLAVVGVALYLFPLGPTESSDPPWTTVAGVAGALVLAAVAALALRRNVPGLGRC
jgi:peptidoglycan/LPS O-acetylase OafA/YrhL